MDPEEEQERRKLIKDARISNKYDMIRDIMDPSMSLTQVFITHFDKLVFGMNRFLTSKYLDAGEVLRNLPFDRFERMNWRDQMTLLSRIDTDICVDACRMLQNAKENNNNKLICLLLSYPNIRACACVVDLKLLNTDVFAQVLDRLRHLPGNQQTDFATMAASIALNDAMDMTARKQAFNVVLQSYMDRYISDAGFDYAIGLFLERNPSFPDAQDMDDETGKWKNAVVVMNDRDQETAQSLIDFVMEPYEAEVEEANKIASASEQLWDEERKDGVEQEQAIAPLVLLMSRGPIQDEANLRRRIMHHRLMSLFVFE